MQISTDELRKHYASLSDEGLREINAGDLTEVARKFYEDEVKSRRLARAAEPPEQDGFPEVEADADWLENAVCVCSFRHAHSTNGVDATSSRDALLAAGIPCEVSVVPATAGNEDEPSFDEYRVMVPVGLHLHAKNVLDEQFFNAETEAGIRAHLAELSDTELLALSPGIICAGLRDLIARLTRAYEEEVARRDMQ